MPIRDVHIQRWLARVGRSGSRSGGHTRRVRALSVLAVALYSIERFSIKRSEPSCHR